MSKIITTTEIRKRMEVFGKEIAKINEEFLSPLVEECNEIIQRELDKRDSENRDSKK